MQNYFASLESQLETAHKVAVQARRIGRDPEKRVDIPIAKNMAERVQGLLSIVAPDLLNSGFTKRVMELEDEYGALAWEVALIIAKEVAQEKFCKFESKIKAMEVGIRAGFAYHTLGIVSAPLEGFVELKEKKRMDGKPYLALSFAGPIRGAGGTAASVAVLIGDYIREAMGYEAYDPTDDELNRFVAELEDYHERITNLQYHPSEEEIKYLIRSIPVEVDGDPSERIDVSNYKDLPRIETNKIRSGVCLVVSMIALKAPKLWKRVSKWEGKFNTSWGFLEEFLKLQKEKKAKKSYKEEKELTPNYTFIEDLVAGRPVLTYPMAKGGFRLRFGRSRISGFSAAGIHPATMHILDKFVATGTQLKVERPGKAAAITPCDSIEGPIVKLNDGSVRKIRREPEAKAIAKQVVEIIHVGDILFNYGDFAENNHSLVPLGYCPEWWILELEKACVNHFGALDYDKLSELTSIPQTHLKKIFKEPLITRISPKAAYNISRNLGVPLHPDFTFYWKQITQKQFWSLVEWYTKLNIIFTQNNSIEKSILPYSEEHKSILEILGVEHLCINKEFIVFDEFTTQVILQLFGIKDAHGFKSILKTRAHNKEADDKTEKTGLDVINSISKVTQRDKGGTYIGARMGRPEKAKQRKLTGAPHVLFPVGEEGGRLRSFQAALQEGAVSGEFSMYHCAKCDRDTAYPVCEICSRETQAKYYCRDCNKILDEPCPKHEISSRSRPISLDINHYFEAALKKLSFKTYPDLIKGVRGTANKDHVPENLAKGILRAKHNIFVNKDGTTRYDMSELPITHFKPKEVRAPFERLIELGYDQDIYGKPLERNDQILEIKPQDIILPTNIEGFDEAADEVLFRVSKFIDELLVKFYDLKPFYNLKTTQDLIGHQVIGLAPHISAGIIGRIIGFSNIQGLFAHPLMHAAMRRDCDGDEACVILLMDAFLNFSRQFLPDKRGGRTMDAPLVLTATLIPSEVDDMVFGMDVVDSYPLEIYDACANYKYPWEVQIKQLKDNLGTVDQYENHRFTHSVSDINSGVICSAYKVLPTMEDKLKGQMNLARKIRAVNEAKVAQMVIEKHFIKDIKGNLRKFSKQQFRCVRCNTKFRRPPLLGACPACNGGKIIFTISEGSVIKYLKPSISLAEKFAVTSYLKQSLELTQRRIESIFGKEKESQENLGKWFG